MAEKKKQIRPNPTPDNQTGDRFENKNNLNNLSKKKPDKNKKEGFDYTGNFKKDFGPVWKDIVTELKAGPQGSLGSIWKGFTDFYGPLWGSGSSSDGINYDEMQKAADDVFENTNAFKQYLGQGDTQPSNKPTTSPSTSEEQPASRMSLAQNLIKGLQGDYEPASFTQKSSGTVKRYNPETEKMETVKQVDNTKETSYYEDRINKLNNVLSGLQENYEDLDNDQKYVFDTMKENLLSEEFLNRVREYQAADKAQMFDDYYSQAVQDARYSGGSMIPEDLSTAEKVLAYNRAKEMMSANNPLADMLAALEGTNTVNKQRNTALSDYSSGAYDINNLASGMISETDKARAGVAKSKNESIAKIIKSLLDIDNDSGDSGSLLGKQNSKSLESSGIQDEEYLKEVSKGL